MSLMNTLTERDGMTHSTNLDEAVTSLGGQPSIVEKFTINGLYGYRSISMQSEYAATILIAKNGSGKTTMLGALDAFLKTQFTRLSDVNFNSIECKFHGYEGELILYRDDVVQFMDISEQQEIISYSKKIDLDAKIVFQFLIEDYPGMRGNYRALEEDRVFQALERNVGYKWHEVTNLCENLRASAYRRNKRVRHVHDSVNKILSDIEVVYLPTYRRIELAMAGETQELRTRTRMKRPKLRVSAGSLFKGDIQFGLSDISERLAEMNQQISSESNQGYRRISANIINELLDGTFEKEIPQDKDVPSAEAVSVFLTRIKEGGVGPYYPVSIPDLARVQAGANLVDGSSRFLRYFLAKLGTVIQATKDVEARVETFVESCNKYLSERDKSTFIPETNPNGIVNERDGKALFLNRKNLSVQVESLPSKRRIPLDALSSGEKQMVSLFARLYLYPSRKIVLIDEPELSLSIDWQRKILIDVLAAPQCLQVIAITHSPFVFDNGLEPFARSLRTSIDEDALASKTQVYEGFDASED